MPNKLLPLIEIKIISISFNATVNKIPPRYIDIIGHFRIIFIEYLNTTYVLLWQEERGKGGVQSMIYNILAAIQNSDRGMDAFSYPL